MSEIMPGSRWRSHTPMRVTGDRRATITEAVVTLRGIQDGFVYLRVVKGNGSRKGRTYGMSVADLLDGWDRR
jgi:hypothetical protein